MEKLYIYTRISSDEQEDGHSLETQKEIGYKKAKENNLIPYLKEEGVASSKNEELKHRPELRDIISQIEKGNIRHLYGKELTRFSRDNVLSAQLLKTFKENNVLIYTKNFIYNLLDPIHEFMATIEFGISKFENSQRAERIKVGIRKAAEKGMFSGPSPPYGFRRINNKKGNPIEIDPEESIIVKRIFKLVIEGNGQNTIARILNDEGIPTKRGGKYIWKGGTVYGVVSNTIHIGERKYKDEVFVVPSIIDKTTWVKAHHQLNTNKNYSSNHTKHFYLLKGLLKCGRCNRNLAGLIKENKGMRLYYCRSKRPDPDFRFCGMKSINIYKLNDLVWFGLLKVLTKSSKLRAYLARKFNNAPNEVLLLDKKISSQESKITDLEIRRSRLAKGYVDGKFTDKDYDKLKQELDNDLAIADESLKSLVSRQKAYMTGQSQYKEFINYLDKMDGLKGITDENEKKRILNIFIQEIVVDWLEEKQEHVIEIRLRVPLEVNGTDVLHILGDGTDLDTGTTVIEQDLRWYDEVSGRDANE